MDVTSNRSQHQIKNGDIVLTYLGMLCAGKPYFEAVHEMDDDKDFYKAALGITRSIPSEEMLRQRMDDIGDSLRQAIPGQNVEMLLANKIQPGMTEYNILRMIGQGTIGGWEPRQKRDVKRCRLRTVISNLIMMAGHVTMHARQLIVGLGIIEAYFVYPFLFG